MRLISLVGTVTLGVASVNAFFRMPCNQPVVVERADPIVNPGLVSGHVHTIMGGNGFNFTQDYNQARSSTCSTCKAKKDASNYWIPHLYYQSQSGQFTPVKQNGGALIYYLQRYSSNSNTLTPFPPGFRMLAGDPTLRSYNDSSLAQRAVSWVCLNYASSSPQTPAIPNNNCPDGLRSQVFFPSCWDGVNLDTPNHKDHVAYPSNMDSGDCPASHPVRLVSIFYEVIWNVNDFKDMWWKPNGQHPFVLSMGDPTGYGHHGDFLNGWDVDALNTAITKCTQNSGVIEDCAADLELYTDAEMNDCRNPPQVDEVITGWLDSLPGCNTVQNGPAKATMGGSCGKTTPAILPKNEVAFVTNDIPLWDAVGCAQDNLNARLLPQKYTDPAQTIEKCMSTCLSHGYQYAGLEWGVECWCGNSFDTSKANLQGSCTQPCAGDSSEMCGNAGILSVYHYNPNKTGGSSSQAPPPAVSTTSSSTPTSTSVHGVTLSLYIPPAASTTRSVQNTLQVSASSSSSTTPAAASSSTSLSMGQMPGHQTPSGWKYRGCYVDALRPTRSLNGSGMWYDVPMTPKACTDHCAQKGFAIAGTEYSGECYCGNSFTSTAILRPDTECNMRCRGDSTVMCGGPARLSVYSTDTRNLKRNDIDDLFERDDEELVQGSSSEGGALAARDEFVQEEEKRGLGNVSHVVRSPSANYADMHRHHRRALHHRSF